LFTGYLAMSTRSLFLGAGAFAAMIAVAAGAFGAHVLRDALAPRMLEVYLTAAQYQMYHALALIATGLLCGQGPGAPLVAASGWCFIVGIVLFSGSLFALTLSGISALGMITPLGGVLFIVGWALLFFGTIRRGDGARGD